MNNLTYLKNVVTLELDSSKCTGCGMCALVCPHRVFEINNRKSEINNIDRCMECGACALNCSEMAISVNKGVGCAAAVISGYLKKSEPACSCG
jgi:NAD-dependent dihydropyrimidine dehydrogenase PreA subunit